MSDEAQENPGQAEDGMTGLGYHRCISVGGGGG